MAKDVFKALQEEGVRDPKAQIVRFAEDNLNIQSAIRDGSEGFEYLHEMLDTADLDTAMEGDVVMKHPDGLWKPGRLATEVPMPTPQGPSHENYPQPGYPAQLQGIDLSKVLITNMEQYGVNCPRMDRHNIFGMGENAPIVMVGDSISVMKDTDKTARVGVGVINSFVFVSARYTFIANVSSSEFSSLPGTSWIYYPSGSNRWSRPALLAYGSGQTLGINGDQIVVIYRQGSGSSAYRYPAKLSVDENYEVTATTIGDQFNYGYSYYAISVGAGYIWLNNSWASLDSYIDSWTSASYAGNISTIVPVDENGDRCFVRGRDLIKGPRVGDVTTYENVIPAGYVAQGHQTYWKDGVILGLFKDGDRVVLLSIDGNGVKEQWRNSVDSHDEAIVNPGIDVNGNTVLFQPVISSHLGVSLNDYSKGNVIMKMELTPHG